MDAEPQPSKTEPGTMQEELESLIEFCDKRSEFYLDRGDSERINEFMALKTELRSLMEEEKYKGCEDEEDVVEALNELALERFDLRGGKHGQESVSKRASRVDVFKEIQKRLIAYTGEIGDSSLAVKETWEERYSDE